MKNITAQKLLTLIAGTLLLISYFFIFIRFFPNRLGFMGHDCSLLFPSLLDNYIWIKKNGLLEAPWFTPSFCGGFLNFAHPQGGAYSIPYILIIFFDPLSVVILTFVMFAVIGFFSMYLLLRSVFCFSNSSSIFGAGIFLFNGFYSHRMLVGHFGYYPFMITPLLLFFLLHPVSKNGKASSKSLFYVLSAGVIFSYMVYSGYLTLMIPTILSIITIGILYGLLFPGSLYTFWVRLGFAGFTGLALSSSKLATIIYIMKNFTRSDYQLPGFDSFLSSALTAFKSIFTNPAFEPERIDSLVNLQWYLGRHEWEYSLTIIPLLIIIYGAFRLTGMLLKNHKGQGFFPEGRIIPILIMIFILLLPVILNTYTPEWNLFLKKIPVIKSASSLIRWYIIYIPFVVVLSSLVLEKHLKRRTRWVIAVAGLLCVILINGLTERVFYHSQFYDPREIQEAYYKVKTGEWNPEIKSNAIYVNEKGEPIRPGNSNDLFTKNASQLLCYEPLLGYDLSYFPQKSLQPGPVLDEHEGNLNIKNPACYVWPVANSCEPGEHFKIDQKKEALEFSKYRPFNFTTPPAQKIANWVSIIALISVFIYLSYNLLTFGARSDFLKKRK